MSQAPPTRAQTRFNSLLLTGVVVSVLAVYLAKLLVRYSPQDALIYLGVATLAVAVFDQIRRILMPPQALAPAQPVPSPIEKPAFGEEPPRYIR